MSGLAAGAVHAVVPPGIDDPSRPSGGNGYDRRVCRELAACGWSVREHAVPGSWPTADSVAMRALADELAGIPAGATVLVDGLIGSAAPSVLVPQSERLRLVVLVHMPLEDEGERAVLPAAAAVVTTSEWTRGRLLERYPLRPERVHVAVPGADRGDLVTGTAGGGSLLCVAAVSAHKGHDLLVAALARLADLPWRCVCVGALDRDPGFVERLRSDVEASGIADRVELRGTRAGPELDGAYEAADVLVLASRGETYGMVVTEALARGLPVIAFAVGGVPEALGSTADGQVPGLLVPPEDVDALTDAVQRWLRDADLRAQLRQAARERRHSLPSWPTTADRIARALAD